jgi:hypothetical protein
MSANNVQRHTVARPTAVATNISKITVFSFTGPPHKKSDPNYEIVLLHGFQCQAEDEIEA